MRYIMNLAGVVAVEVQQQPYVGFSFYLLATVEGFLLLNLIDFLRSKSIRFNNHISAYFRFFP